MGLVVEPIDPPDFQAWQVALETAQDMPIALAAAASLGYQGGIQTFIQPNSFDPATGMPIVLWTVTFKRPGDADLVAYMSDWIVYDGVHITVHTNAEFVDRYTADVPLVWDAVPVAEALPNDQVALTFAGPTSANGPFTYTVTAHDGETETALNVIEESGNNGVVTLKGDGLITGRGYTFTVKVTSGNNHEATSAVSEQITAIL